MIAQAKKPLESAFANINDGSEITVIADESRIIRKDIIKAEKDFRLITFNVALPFSTVGFLAKVSKVLAEEKIPIFVVSGYSFDHLLVKEEFLGKAVSKLKELEI